MKKVENCWTLEPRETTDSDIIIPGRGQSGNMIQLANGRWLRDMGDGRLYTDGNESEKWATVVDWDVESGCGTLLGYCIV